MFIGTGFDSLNVETVDMSGSGSGVHCQTGLNRPLFRARRGMTGAISAMKPVLCGGQRSSSFYNDCHQYIPETNNWDSFTSMSHERVFAQTIQLDENQFWITGINYSSVLTLPTLV